MTRWKPLSSRAAPGPPIRHEVFWTPEAEQDRVLIWDYLAARDPAAAIRLDKLFSEACARLVDFPLLGHTGEIAGTGELTPQRF